MPGFAMDFERPLFELEDKLAELRELDVSEKPELARQIVELADEIELLRVETYENLTAWQRVQISRHPERPKLDDYLVSLFTDVIELHGDRAFRDDAAIVAGWARLDGDTVMIIGHQRGRDTKENIRRNFGMPHPEGYRKALRLMKLAEKFQVPVITLIDTTGAWAGIGAEERGQSEAIARNLYEMSRLEVPIIATVIGEGGSGGALALGVADRVLMLENAVYSVISVEGCASILWKDGKSPEMREKAADALKITAPDLKALGIIDDIVPEPLGGAHANHDVAAAALGASLVKHLDELRGTKPERLVRRRREKFLKMGQVVG
jgi:acetyl-CoA carboxylase carboxyl transferase subunit alpha